MFSTICKFILELNLSIDLIKSAASEKGRLSIIKQKLRQKKPPNICGQHGYFGRNFPILSQYAFTLTAQNVELTIREAYLEL